jgi:hypothetical protein
MQKKHYIQDKRFLKTNQKKKNKKIKQKNILIKN